MTGYWQFAAGSVTGLAAGAAYIVWVTHRRRVRALSGLRAARLTRGHGGVRVRVHVYDPAGRLSSYRDLYADGRSEHTDVPTGAVDVQPGTCGACQPSRVDWQAYERELRLPAPAHPDGCPDCGTPDGRWCPPHCINSKLAQDDDGGGGDGV